MNYDILIHNATIVTVNPAFDIIESGWVGIRADRLAGIGPAAGNGPIPPAGEIIDAHGGIVMPGLINTHTHLPMTIFRGLADDLPLLEWLNEIIFPAETAHIDSETVFLGALLGCAESMLSGTTTCCDGYFFEDAVARAVQEAGMRAVLGHGVIDFPAPGVPDPSTNVRYAMIFAEKWANRSPLILPSIFCHSPYTCSALTLKNAKDAARAGDLLFQIHVAETSQERNRIQADGGVSPVEHLDGLGVLDGRTLLVHAVWIGDEDIQRIAGCGAAVSHNPESNMKLASGIAPIPELIKAGVCVGLGTDGCASNNDLDLLREMDMAAKLHKVNLFDPTVMDARKVVEMATIDGAKAIGLDTAVGSLEIGKQADVVILDSGRPHLVPMYHPASHIVYAAVGSDVKDVIVAGKVVVRNGSLQTLDVDALMRRVNTLALDIRGENKKGGLCT